MGYTGIVRKTDTDSINRRLDDGAIVLISPLGHSYGGKTFNLSMSEAAEAEVRQQEEAAQQTAPQPEAQSPKKPETRWDRIRHFIRRHVTQGNNDSMD